MYVATKDVIDGIIEKCRLTQDERVDLVRHILEGVDPSRCKELVTDTIVEEWVENNVGALADYITAQEVEEFCEKNGDWDFVLDEDVVADWCRFHGNALFDGNGEEAKEFVEQWCKDYGYAFFKENDNK
jgi:hypothetical protein